MEPSESTILAGKYALRRKLGQGGMGSVWVAEHLTLHSQVAVKLIDPLIASEPEALSRFLREARSAAALRSPHVVQILDHGVDDGTPYIVMELLDGESLADRLKRTLLLSPAETARIMTQVARAVGRAHQAGIVHRDLKPDNIFLVHNDDDEVAKVLDFGIAKSTDAGLGPSGVGTRTGALMGTPYYMSPEQTEGIRGVDARSDIWSLGVIAFECLIGRRPFESESIGALVLAICSRPRPVPSTYGQVPAGFDDWFACSCSRDPLRRFQSAKEQAAELRRICGIEPGSGRDVASAPRSPLGPALASPVDRLAVSTSPMATTRKRNRSDSRPSWLPRGWVIASGAGLAAIVVVAVWNLFRSTPPDAIATPRASAAVLVSPVSAAPSGSAALAIPTTRSSGVDIMSLPNAPPEFPPAGSVRMAQASASVARMPGKPRPSPSTSPGDDVHNQPTKPAASPTVNLGF